MDMTLNRFPPESLIEITDSMVGGRKLGIVTESGTAYVDLIDDDTPFPVYAALDPVDIGTPLSWGLTILSERPAPESNAFVALQDALLVMELDSLTYARAVYWAYCTRNYTVTAALKAGCEATNVVRGARAKMDRILAKANAA